MLFLLSPSKALDFQTPINADLARSNPRFAKESQALAAHMREMSPAQLQSLMGISAELAALNHERFRRFRTNAKRQAVLAFDGDVYGGLDAPSLPSDVLARGQDRLRILSGLYGLLRPLDLIRPYRLEMGLRVQGDWGSSLYAYWGDQIARQLNADLAGHAHKVIINLASDEYAKAVDRKVLKAPMITLNFKDVKDGKARALFLYLKRARGEMARFALERQVDRPEGLKDFTGGGYRFSARDSQETEWVFTRPQPPPIAELRRLSA